jgi:hypothetical protein
VKESLKNKYRDILVGYEKYSYDEKTLLRYQGDLDNVLVDQLACMRCDGIICKSSLNHHCKNPYQHLYKKDRLCGDECYSNTYKGYYGLHKAACRNSEHPGFAVFECPGPKERKKGLVEQLQTAKYDDSQAPLPVLAGARQWEENDDEQSEQGRLIDA